MGKILSILPFLSICLAFSARAQAPDSATRTYALVVQFQSVCCGVPDDAPLQKAIRQFRKKYKTRRITADKIGPMGREGEYYLAFRLKELSPKQKNLFIKKLEQVAPQLKDRGQAVIEKNMQVRMADLPANVSIEKMRW